MHRARGLLFGTAGFQYPDWKGVVYPRRAGAAFDPLAFLAEHVDLVEINASFYAPLAAGVAETWIERVRAWPRLAFVAKVWKALSHGGAELPAKAAISGSLAAARVLAGAGRLAALLLQLPPSFRPGPHALARLLGLRDALAPLPAPLAVEFRDRAWQTEEEVARLRREGLSWVNVDLPRGGRNPLPSSFLAAEPAYVRFHGRNAEAWFDPRSGRDARYDHLYTRAELEPWLPRIESLRSSARTTLVVGNNHYQGKALALVFELAHLLSGERPRIPEELLARYPHLVELAKSPEDRLF
jgi:uncharacterized protein YecE (DUF72 family)